MVKIRNAIFAFSLAACSLPVAAFAQNSGANVPQPKAAAPKTDPSVLKTNSDKASYVIGRNLASQLQGVPFKISNDALFRGIADELAGAELPLTREQIEAALGEIEKEIAEEQAKKAAGDKQFLVENAKKEGVQSTPSGLQYKVISQGTGAKPKATDQVTTHYEGRLVDGTVFDSSIQRGEPATFPLDGVISGWTEALQLMPVGSKWQLYIPAELAYGENPRPGGPIYPGATLIFDIELISIGEAPAREVLPQR